MFNKTLTIIFAVLLVNGLFAQLQNILVPIGNIGVGTLFPATKLHIVGATRIDGNLKINQDLEATGLTTLGQVKLPSLNLVVPGASAQVLVRDGITGSLEAVLIEDILFGYRCTGENSRPAWHSEGDRLYADCPSDLRVGIGTANPQSLLEVDGMTATRSICIGENTNPANQQAALYVKKSLNPQQDETVMLVESDQRKLLQLNTGGLLRVREVKLDATSWPDYVFEPDYKLPTAQELKVYVAEHHHLPGIPSAAEVEQHGMNVMEMNRLLLEKIEVLTLLMIRQQEQIDAIQTNTPAK